MQEAIVNVPNYSIVEHFVNIKTEKNQDVRKKQSIKTDKITCNICQKSFSNKKSLRIPIHRSVRKQIQCHPNKEYNL